jgi:nucleoid-associated protein YgaU
MRYFNQDIFINDDPGYKKLLEKRGKTDIRQYNTPRFKHPDSNDARNYSEISHIWGAHDRYYKLAEEYYKDPTLWWVIALYNQKPTEFDVKAGDVIYIPTPLETALYYMGY